VWLHFLAPTQAAALIVAFGLIVQGVSVWKLRHAIKWPRLVPFLIGGAIGVPIGGELLRWTPPRNLRIAVGAILVLFSLYNLIRPNLASAARAGVIADGAVGVANGVIGGATGLAGIAAVIWCSLRGWPPAEQRAVFQPSGVAVFAITALWLGGTGMISANTLTLFFIGLPVLAVGTWARLKLFGKLDDQAFRRGSANLAAVVGPQPARPGPIMPVSYSGRMHAKDSFPLALDQGIARPYVRTVGPKRSRPAFPRRSPKHCTSPAHRAKGLWRNLSDCKSQPGGGLENPMPDVTLFGFPRSVYVQMAGIVLTHKEVAYTFHDLEAEMNTPSHIALHPFERVPILQHGDFVVYETAAIVGYIDNAFDGPKLTPADPRQRARMNQWISAVNGYYYPNLIYHVSHERNVFPQLGIPSDEKVVAHAIPKVEVCLQVLERELLDSGQFLLGPELSLADFYMLPIIHAFGFAPEAQTMYPKHPAICAWRERMEALPALKRFRAAQPPRAPIEHARRWLEGHRPKY